MERSGVRCVAMTRARQVGPRRATVVRCGLGLLVILGPACPGDDGEDTGAGTTGGTTMVADDGTGPGVTGSEGSTSPGDTTGGTTLGTTLGMDESSSGGESSSGEPVEEVFFPEVLAIVQAECFCHRGPMVAGQLDLNDDVAYGSLLDVPAPQAPDVSYVSPGDPDNSYLYLKLVGEQLSVGGSGTRMPQGGVLTDDQILRVRHWILTGAQP